MCATNTRGLERVGIEVEDLSKSVNDGCTTAVKAGRLTVGGDRETMNQRAEDVKDGCCDMHIASLVIGVATTLTPRREGGVVVNKWKDFHDLIAKLKTCAKHLCDRKNKGRFDKYTKTILAHDGSAVIALPMPNKTRVSGAYMLMFACLRSMHALKIYSLEDSVFESKFLYRCEWALLAEIESIMKETNDFCFDVQGNRPEIACEQPLMLAYLKCNYENATEFEVIDINKKWKANIKPHEIPRKTIALGDMLPQSRELVNRFIDSIDEYFGPGKANTDRCEYIFVYFVKLY